MPSDAWDFLGSESLREYRVLRLREDTYRFTPTGDVTGFAVCDSADWVLVIPVTVDNQVVFVRQFRPGRGEVILEPGMIWRSYRTCGSGCSAATAAASSSTHTAIQDRRRTNRGVAELAKKYSRVQCPPRRLSVLCDSAVNARPSATETSLPGKLSETCWQDRSDAPATRSQQLGVTRVSTRQRTARRKHEFSREQPRATARRT
jgi:hypothetical protein